MDHIREIGFGHCFVQHHPNHSLGRVRQLCGKETEREQRCAFKRFFLQLCYMILLGDLGLPICRGSVGCFFFKTLG